MIMNNQPLADHHALVIVVMVAVTGLFERDFFFKYYENSEIIK